MPADLDALIRSITTVRFTPVRLREGYTMGEVDAFLDRLVAALRSGELAGDLVAAARFTPVRLREGYDMAEVDDFLEQVVAGVAPAAPMAPSVIQEQRGLLSRLFSRG